MHAGWMGSGGGSKREREYGRCTLMGCVAAAVLGRGGGSVEPVRTEWIGARWDCIPMFSAGTIAREKKNLNRRWSKADETG